jgi:hypothetical protein
MNPPTSTPTPTYPTSWNDQPSIVTQAKPIFSFNAESRMIEVRRNGPDFFISIGNLFGSQTLTTTDIDTLFHLLESAAKARHGKKIACPELATVIHR